MKIIFLGTAAGGGIPQWNCACHECQRARRDGEHRTQDCLAVSADGQAWYLVNTSPDLRTQLLRTPELAPGPGVRDTPVRGVLFTSAELDHTAGLVSLREASQLTVYATQTVLEALPWLPILSHYTQVDRRAVVCGRPCKLDGGLTVTAFSLGPRRPRYAIGRPAADDWVIGLHFTDPRGKSLVYAPCLTTWTSAAADLVVLDGTFFTANEPAIYGGGLGHLPIQDSLPHLRSHPGPRYLYTHLNNTNPVSRNDSPHRALLTATGADVAPEAGLIEL